MTLIPPVLTLIGWTFVMWVWLYATRIQALRAARVDLVAVSRTVQATRNVIIVRFWVFATASLVLLLLLLRTAWLLVGT